MTNTDKEIDQTAREQIYAAVSWSDDQMPPQLVDIITNNVISYLESEGLEITPKDSGWQDIDTSEFWDAMHERARQDRVPAINGPFSNLDTFALEGCWSDIERMLREHGNLPSPPLKQGDEGS